MAEPLRLWDAAQGICAYRQGADAFAASRCLAYLAANARPAPPALVTNWRWHLRLWDDAGRRGFWDTMMRGWHARQEREPAMRSATFIPGSPYIAQPLK